MALTDRTILVTRPERQSEAMARSIIEAGGRCVVIPMIEIVQPESWSDCDEIVSRLQAFDAAAFASANAVDAFCARAAAGGRQLQGLFPDGVLAVGQSTADAARRFGLTVLDVPPGQTGKAAGRSAGRRFAGKSVLIPRGDLGLDELPDALKSSGAAVTTVVVYRTISPSPAVLGAVADRVKQKEFDVVSFASPSAVRNFMRGFSAGEIGTMTAWCLLAVIGSTTAAALRTFGLEPDIMAPEASAGSFVESIIAHYSKK